MAELYNPFLTNFVVASLLSIATISFYDELQIKTNSKTFSSLIMTLFLAIIFIVPLTYFIATIVKFSNEITSFDITSIIADLNIFLSTLSMPEMVKVNFITALNSIDIASNVKGTLSSIAGIGSHGASIISSIFMILIFYFFINIFSSNITQFIKKTLPLKPKMSDILFLEISNVMGVVFYSIIVTAIFEGVLFGAFVEYFGYDGVLFGILYGFASLIPVVGGIIMWLPLAIYEAFYGETVNAIFIAIYSVVVISIIADTIIKPLIIKYINVNVVKTPTQISELVIFFSIIAGLASFGFWGMILGPAITTFFISVLQLFTLLNEGYLYNQKDNLKEGLNKNGTQSQ
jgi:predicted PurR-regulated permease PerM